MSSKVGLDLALGLLSSWGLFLGMPNLSVVAGLWFVRWSARHISTWVQRLSVTKSRYAAPEAATSGCGAWSTSALCQIALFTFCNIQRALSQINVGCAAWIAMLPPANQPLVQFQP